MRAYPYTKAHIGRGVESFNQLHALRKKSATDRRKWWEDLKRLQEVSLLCFVSFTNNKTYLLFLTVSEKRTDPNASYSLSSHNRISTTVTKFVTHNQRDLELLIQLRCQDTRGALIEFPEQALSSLYHSECFLYFRIAKIVLLPLSGIFLFSSKLLINVTDELVPFAEAVLAGLAPGSISVSLSALFLTTSIQRWAQV
jgi:hypothetical protein